MERARQRLLSRYLEAAEAIAQLPRSHGGPVPDSEPGSHAAGNGLEGCDTRPEPADAESAATQQLLRRQAGLLARMHRGAAADGALVRRRLDDIACMATDKLYAYRYDRVPHRWRCLYTDALVLMTHLAILDCLAARAQLSGRVLDTVVECLDRALITTGGAGCLGGKWIEQTLQMLEAWCAPVPAAGGEGLVGPPPPGAHFPDSEPFGRPPLALGRACARHSGWSLGQFEDHANAAGGGPRPAVFTDLMADWPALDDRPWRRRDYLLSRTFGGRRLVPVEVGRSYVDEGWGQELLPFGDFVEQHISPGGGGSGVGYLAQHNLFGQIPSLRNDIRVPDFCWASVPPHPTDPSRDQPRVDVPQLNAWFGPARTITPLHTDGYHNLLCQVVGAKYVRLYPPTAPAAAMRPRAPEHGVDMSNTSQLDLGVLEGWDEPPAAADDAAALDDMRRGLQGVEYCECVLQPGETLFIPIGWWHYVRSLSVSFSVSFWWN